MCKIEKKIRVLNRIIQNQTTGTSKWKMFKVEIAYLTKFIAQPE